jgi:hypothetical protein
MASDLIRKILESLNSEVLSQLDLAKNITHPGESGRSREQIVAAFFQRLLPKSSDISTGFVIDATGAISKQIDIVIYRNDYHPVFEIGGIKHFLIESVAVVMENKSSIASKTTLYQALENIKSVKKLDRTNHGKNYTLHGSERGPEVNPAKFQDQVFSAILTEESLSRDTLKQEFLGFLRSNPDRNLWPNFYADVRHLSISYLKSIKPGEASVIPSEAIYLGLTDKTSVNFVPSLIELAFEVINFLRIAPQIDFSPTDYLLAGSGKIDYYKI